MQHQCCRSRPSASPPKRPSSAAMLSIPEIHHDILSPDFAREDILILLAANCSGLDPRGLVSKVADVYPETSIYGNREKTFIGGRPVARRRDQPGGIKFFFNSSTPNAPLVAALFVQYLPSEPIERDPIIRNICETCVDAEYVKGAMEDTSEMREKNLYSGLVTLLDSFQHRADLSKVRTILIPKVTKAGPMSPPWAGSYESAFEKFAHALKGVLGDRCPDIVFVNDEELLFGMEVERSYSREEMHNLHVPFLRKHLEMLKIKEKICRYPKWTQDEQQLQQRLEQPLMEQIRELEWTIEQEERRQGEN